MTRPAGGVIGRVVLRAVRSLVGRAAGAPGPRADQHSDQDAGSSGDRHADDRYADDRYPGDFTGRARIEYRPNADGDADPGEVVWGWVPYEEDHRKGKDRPVLVIGRDGDRLLGLPLTSKDHDRDAAQEARAGRHWFDVGTGAWDPRRRPSEVRLDRIVRLDPAQVRREGAALDRPLFEAVAERVRAVNGWT